MVDKDKEVVQMQLPIWHARLLRRWANAKGRPRATMAGDIIQARIEANEEQIMRMHEEVAEMKGISAEELDIEIGIVAED